MATFERSAGVFLLFVYFFKFALGVCSLLVLWGFEGFFKYTADTSSTTMCIRQATRAEMKAQLNWKPLNMPRNILHMPTTLKQFTYLPIKNMK